MAKLFIQFYENQVKVCEMEISDWTDKQVRELITMEKKAGRDTFSYQVRGGMAIDTPLVVSIGERMALKMLAEEPEDIIEIIDYELEA